MVSSQGYKKGGWPRTRMIHAIQIKGYRAFDDFSMSGLGRINLLVGKNNTGKSSLLEALSLLWADNDPNALWQILSKRGEHPVIETTPGRPIQLEVDVGHLFKGHQAQIGSSFTISTTNETPERSIRYEVVEADPKDNPVLFNMLASQEPAGAVMALKITVNNKSFPPIPLTQRGSLRHDILFNAFFSLARTRQSEREAGHYIPAHYIPTESLSTTELLQLWNKIALTSAEGRVIHALRYIDPDIKRVSPVFGLPIIGGIGIYRGGFLVRRRGEERIPIGSLGDGIWRMFSLAIVLSANPNGLVLIDEIDTGLHYTVMEKMWHFVNEVSKEFQIQIFATTHSYDCVHALASICNESEEAKEISIQKIEAGKNRAIHYSEPEIRIAARRHIEVR